MIDARRHCLGGGTDGRSRRIGSFGGKRHEVGMTSTGGSAVAASAPRSSAPKQHYITLPMLLFCDYFSGDRLRYAGRIQREGDAIRRFRHAKPHGQVSRPAFRQSRWGSYEFLSLSLISTLGLHLQMPGDSYPVAVGLATFLSQVQVRRYSA